MSERTTLLSPLPEKHDVEITPAGIEVLFSPAPKRLYKVRGSDGCDPDRGEWIEVPSVTEILNVIDKSGPMIWWGQGVGAEGVLELLRRDRLVYSHLAAWVALDEDGERVTVPATQENLVKALVQEKISTNHVRDKAADRGTAVHQALEHWADHGTFPDLDLFPVEQQGYAQGVKLFLEAVPSAKAVGSEVMVGSVKHGFAGRYDLRLEITAEHEVVTHTYPKRKPKMAVLTPGLLLCDLKTSKGVYPTHALQLAAYELASIECGYGPTVGRGILHVTAEGGYEFRRAKASGEDFLSVLDLHRRYRAAKEWI